MMATLNLVDGGIPGRWLAALSLAPTYHQFCTGKRECGRDCLNMERPREQKQRQDAEMDDLEPISAGI